MNFAKVGLVILLAAGVALIVFALDIVQLPDDTFFQRELNNSGHTPLFGLVALMVLALSRLSLMSFRWPPHWHYGIALVLSSVLGLFSELIQMAGPRDADLIDFIRDLAGILSFLAIHYSFGSIDKSRGQQRSRRIRLRVGLSGAILLLGSLVPLGLVGGSYLHRDQAFPRIADFESYWENLFLLPNDADLRILPNPVNLNDTIDNNAVEVILGLTKYPGLVLSEVYPDWRGYKFLTFEVFSKRTDTISLEARINDIRHNKTYYDRFNRPLAIAPGLNKFRISLEDVKKAPRSREMEMDQMRAFVLFAISPTESFTFYIDNVILE